MQTDGVNPGTAAFAKAMAANRGAEDRRVLKRVGVVAAAIAVLVVGVIGVRALMPRSVPDYANDPMDEVMDFTLLSDDFNSLPVEKRLDLLKDLIARLKTMSGEDSAMLAGFAATIRDNLRKQLEKNAKRLAVDVMDMYAGEYAGVPADQAGDFLDKKAIEFTRLMEDLTGEKMGLPEDDAERLAVMKRQAQRDQQMMRENAPQRMDAGQVTGLVDFLQRDAGEVADPQQRSRIARFGRDLTRHLRGQDVATGKPKR
jgi:hypothetical protein